MLELSDTIAISVYLHFLRQYCKMDTSVDRMDDAMILGSLIGSQSIEWRLDDEEALADRCR